MLGRRLDFGHVAGREQGPALQKSEVGLQVRRALTGHALLRLRIERELERLRDLHGDLVLDREDVTGPPVEAHRPHVRSGLRVDQLRRHPHARRLALHAAFEQVTRAELAADLARICGPVAKRERRCARYHVELGEARELVQHRFGDAGGEHVGIPRRAQVLEWQHGNRQAPRPAWTEVRLPHQQHGDRRQQHGDDRDVGVTTQAGYDRAGNALGRRVARDT